MPRTRRLMHGRFALLSILAFGCSAPAPRPTAVDRPVQKPVDELVRRNLASFDKVWSTIKDRHWDPKLGGLDWNAVRAELRPKVARAKTVAAARTVMQAMLSRLKESHFAILALSTLDAIRGKGAKHEDGSARAGLTVRYLRDAFLIVAVDAGSPAAKAGVVPGWTLTAVDGKPTRALVDKVGEVYKGTSKLPAMLTRAVQGQLYGPTGSTVKLTLSAAGKTRVVAVTRAAPTGPRASFGYLPALPIRFETRRIGADVGYVHLSVFLDPARIVPGFAKALAGYANTKGIIIDVRGNPGGLIGMVIGMVNHLQDQPGKVLGTMISRTGKVRFVINPQPSTYKGKVAVLIDGLSMSSSEILAAGLRDLGRARLFGRTTAGASLPSTIERLPNGDGFQYAFADYLSASGKRLEGVGVAPDVVVVPTPEQLRSGRDPAVDAATAWIRSPR